MLLANEATYRSLSTFESVEELNEAIKVHKTNNQLSDTERAILDLISRYACKFPGVCYLSKNNIAEAVGRVRRTVIRVCQRLEALGIIKQYETKRETGDRRQSTNVIVILAAEIFAKCEEQTGSRFLTPKRATCHGNDNLSQTNEVTPDMSRQEAPSKNINNNTYKETYISADEVIKRGLRHAIPASIF